MCYRSFPKDVLTLVSTKLFCNHIVGTGSTAMNATNMTTVGNVNIRYRGGGGGRGVIIVVVRRKGKTSEEGVGLGMTNTTMTKTTMSREFT